MPRKAKHQLFTVEQIQAQNITNIEDLLTVPIKWLKTLRKSRWSAIVCNELCELTMNDFPEEPLYTVHWKRQMLDIEDAPLNWVIPRG